jgi:hypothetical protein
MIHNKEIPMKKLSLALLAALFIAPSLVMADPANMNNSATDTPAANGSTANMDNNAAQASKHTRAPKKHKMHTKKKKMSDTTDTQPK